MSIRLLFIIFLLSFACCTTKPTNMEICFERVRSVIKSDTILNKLMYSSVDSYDKFANLIHRSVIEVSKSDTICSNSINQFSLQNKNSITVNNLILFQQFQAYLKHQKFDQSKARDSALYFEKKWKPR